MSNARIPITRLRNVRAVLFGSKRLVGAALARKLRTNQNTFWSWLYRRGMPADDAVKLARIIDDHAAKLTATAAELRTLAENAETALETA